MTRRSKKETAKYGYDQLIQSERYAQRRDALAALLDRAGTYTVSEVDALIDSFMKGTVK